MNVEQARSGTPEWSHDALVGRVIAGRYRIDAALGQGPAGWLYKAAQAPFERVIALRVLPTAAQGRDPGGKFALEAAVAGRLAHPNTVRLIDFGRTEDGAPFLAMEFLTGRPLATVLADGALEETRAIHIAQQICRSLREAHAMQVFHRALRPSSVMLLRQQDEQDFVKVMDFGLPPAATSLPLALLPVEAVRYLAPEQARNQPADARTDVYALGALLYQMLTGRVPFPGTTATEVVVRHLAEAPQPLRSVRPDLHLDESLERIVLRCLHKDRAARFASMDELLEQLKQVRARLTRTTPSLPLPPDTRLEFVPVPPPAKAAQRRKPDRARFEAMARSLRPRPLRLLLGLAAAVASGLLLLVALR